MGKNDGNYNTASPDRYLLLKDFALTNKRFPTDAEKLLWEHIRARQFEYEQIEKDECRTQQLSILGFSVIRFKNEDVLRNISKVLEIIKSNLNCRNE